ARGPRRDPEGVATVAPAGEASPRCTAGPGGRAPPPRRRAPEGRAAAHVLRLAHARHEAGTRPTRALEPAFVPAAAVGGLRCTSRSRASRASSRPCGSRTEV